MTQRVQCTLCDNMILQSTAEKYEGLCAPCNSAKRKADFDATVRGWLEDPSTLPGAHGNPEPDGIVLKMAASQIRSRFYPTEEDRIDSFCTDYFQEVHTKWTDEGSSGLSAKEKHCLAIETFYGEVLNGGLIQYLGNQSGAFAQWAEDAFKAVGIPAFAEVMRNVKQLFPNRNIPEDPDQRWDIVEILGEEVLEEIEEPFWKRYQENEREIRNALYAYLKG